MGDEGDDWDEGGHPSRPSDYFLDRLVEEVETSYYALSEMEMETLVSAYRRGNYERVRRAFLEVLGERFSVEVGEEGETASCLALRCPFCSELIKVAYIGADESRERYRYLWAELKNHLSDRH